MENFSHLEFRFSPKPNIINNAFWIHIQEYNNQIHARTCPICNRHSIHLIQFHIYFLFDILTVWAKHTTTKTRNTSSNANYCNNKMFTRKTKKKEQNEQNLRVISMESLIGRKYIYKRILQMIQWISVLSCSLHLYILYYKLSALRQFIVYIQFNCALSDLFE